MFEYHAMVNYCSISLFFTCVLCVIVPYCIVVVVLWARWGGPDGIEA